MTYSLIRTAHEFDRLSDRGMFGQKVCIGLPGPMALPQKTSNAAKPSSTGDFFRNESKNSKANFFVKERPGCLLAKEGYLSVRE